MNNKFNIDYNDLIQGLTGFYNDRYEKHSNINYDVENDTMTIVENDLRFKFGIDYHLNEYEVEIYNLSNELLLYQGLEFTKVKYNINTIVDDLKDMLKKSIEILSGYIVSINK